MGWVAGDDSRGLLLGEVVIWGRREVELGWWWLKKAEGRKMRREEERLV